MDGRRVLVVDDVADLRDLLDVYLGQHGVLVVGAGTVAEALAAVGPNDVIVTDFLLPDGDGVSLVDEVRRSYPGTPAIVMSGLVLARRCTDAGIQLVAKPFAMQDLAAIVLAVAGERPVPT